MIDRSLLRRGQLVGSCRRALPGLLLLVACSAVATASDHSWPPWDYASGAPESEGLLEAPSTGGRATSSLEIVTVAGFRIYQLALSKPYNAAFNPGGCPFTPSCSAYGLAAIRRHGLLHGLLMTSDRLQRCHPAAAFCGYEIVEEGERLRLMDPPVWIKPDPYAENGVAR